MAPVTGYDAFISYSHQHDTVLGPLLQAGLERFAKPWYRMRAMRVFRDTANLAANPALWGSIEDALRSSQWFILLASADAARSVWVNREVQWWRANRPPERLLIVGTSPGLAWDQYRQDWAAAAPVPPALHGAFTEEPLWVDLSDLQLGGRGPQIPTDRIAAVAAPIRGVPKDMIIGEHLRQHRRAMRLARGAVAVLATLTALAIVASFVAVAQRNSARTQARIATSRELAAVSISNLTTHLDVAQLLAVAAYRMDRNAQTEAAVWQATAASPHLVRFLQAGDTVTALAASATGNVVVAGTASGHIALFDLSTGRRKEVAAGHGGITNVAVSADGGTVAAINGSAAFLWHTGASRATRITGMPSPFSVAVSPSGRFVAALNPVLSATNAFAASVVIRDMRSGENISARADGFIKVAFPSESSLALISGTGDWERLSPVDLHATSEFTALETPAGDFQFGLSPNGRYAGYVKFGGVVAWPTTSSAASNIGMSTVFGSAPDAPSSDLEISPDGMRAATVESGTIFVTELSSTSRATENSSTQLTGAGNTSLVRFLGNNNRLVSASGSSVVLWDLGQVSRLSQPTGVQIPFAGNVGLPPSLLSPADGRLLAVVGGSYTGARVYRTGSRLTLASRLFGAWAAPLSRGDQLLFAGSGPDGRLEVADSGGQVLRSWPGMQFSPVSVRMLPGGERFAAIDGTGAVRVYDLASGAVRQVAAATKFTVRPEQADISPDSSGAVISEWGESPANSFGSIKVVYVDLQTGKSHTVGTGGANGVLFTQDGLILQKATGALQIWNTTGRKLLRTLPGAGGTAAPLAASPDGALVARLHGDGTMSVTDLATGDVLATVSLPAPANSSAADPWDATAMMFTPDGHDLLTATSGGELISWTMDGSSLVRTACASVGRDLTADEWRQYVHTDPPSDLSCGSEPLR